MSFTISGFSTRTTTSISISTSSTVPNGSPPTPGTTEPTGGPPPSVETLAPTVNPPLLGSGGIAVTATTPFVGSGSHTIDPSAPGAPYATLYDIDRNPMLTLYNYNGTSLNPTETMTTVVTNMHTTVTLILGPQQLSGGRGGAPIGGIVGGVVGGVLLLGSICGFLLWRRKRKHQAEKSVTPYDPPVLSQRASKFPAESKSNGTATINTTSQSQTQRTRTESTTKREMMRNMCTCGSGAHGTTSSSSSTHAHQLQPACDPIHIHQHGHVGSNPPQLESGLSPTSPGNEYSPILVLSAPTLGPPSEDMESPPAYRAQEPGDIITSLGIRTKTDDPKT